MGWGGVGTVGIWGWFDPMYVTAVYAPLHCVEGQTAAQFMMDGSGHVGIRWLMVKCLVSVMAQQQPRAVSLKESNHPQMAAELCSQILSVCVVSPLQGPSEGSSLWLCHLHFRPPGSAGS